MMELKNNQIILVKYLHYPEKLFRKRRKRYSFLSPLVSKKNIVEKKLDNLGEVFAENLLKEKGDLIYPGNLEIVLSNDSEYNKATYRAGVKENVRVIAKDISIREERKFRKGYQRFFDKQKRDL